MSACKIFIIYRVQYFPVHAVCVYWVIVTMALALLGMGDYLDVTLCQFLWQVFYKTMSYVHHRSKKKSHSIHDLRIPKADRSE